MTGVYRSPEAEAAVRKAYRDLIDSWPVPHDEAMVETRQGATFVLSFGRPEAPPLVALHGAQGNSSAWLSYAGGWAEHFRVHLVDVVGDAGFSDQTRPDLASDAFADWMDQVLDGLGAPAASFVGVSLGGWMALDYAVRRPQRVNRLVLLAPAGIGRQKNLLLKAFPLLFLGAWGRQRLMHMVFGPPRPEPEAPELRRLSAFVRLVTSATAARPTRIPTITDPQLSALKTPILCIVGGRDVLLDSAGTRDRLAAHAPHARVEFLPDVHHVILDQDAVIADFLRAEL